MPILHSDIEPLADEFLEVANHRIKKLADKIEWIKASDKLPNLLESEMFHYKLNGYKVDGYFLHQRCFQYFYPELVGYRSIEYENFNQIEWLYEPEIK